MKNDSLLDIFFYLSKAIIVIPIVVVIIALIFKFNQRQPSQININSYQLKPTNTPVISPIVQTAKVKLDLKGPFVCLGKIKQASVSAFIFDKKIKIIAREKEKEKNYLIVDDCYYHWQTGQYTGEKICGISPFISVIEMTANYGVLNLESIINQLPQFAPDNKIVSQQAEISTITKNCQKKPVENRIFMFPNNILFTNVTK